MKFRLISRLVASILLLTGLSQVTYAAQARTVRELRAIHCCASQGHDARPVNPRRCCGIDKASDGSSALNPGRDHGTQQPSCSLLFVSNQILPPTRSSSLLRCVNESTRAGPIFLTTRHLQI